MANADGTDIFEIMSRGEVMNMFSNLATPENISNINAQLASTTQDLQQRKINLRQPPYNANLNANIGDILNKALSDISSTGGSIFIPSGFFIIDKKIAPNSNGISIEGIAGKTTFQLAANMNSEFFNIANPITDFSLKGIIFDANKANGGNGSSNAQGACIANTNRFLVEDCQFINTSQDGLSIDTNSTQGLIRNCIVSNTGQDGIVLRNSTSYITVTNCTVNSTGLVGSAGDGIIIKGNYNKVVNNTLTNITNAGVALNAEDGVAGKGFHNVISNNIFNTCTTGIGAGTVSTTLVNAGQLIGNTVISGNVFENITSSIGISVRQMQDVSIIGNTVKDIQASFGILVENSTNVTVDDNVIENTSDVGIYFNASSYVSGHGNVLRNCLTKTGTTTAASVKINGGNNINLNVMIYNSNAYGIYCTNALDVFLNINIDTTKNQGVWILGTSARVIVTGHIKNSQQHGIVVESTSDVSLNALHVHNASLSGNGIYHGILLQGTSTRYDVSGCRVTSDNANKYQNPIYVTSGVTNSLVHSNIMQKGTAGGIQSNGGAGTVIATDNIAI